MIDERHFLDFVYIGTPRAGSTWLSGVLSEHPDVFVPHNKEVHFFNDRHLSSCNFAYLKGLEHYRRYYKDASPTALLGDLSPYYYYDPNCASRLARHFPDVKVLVMLRQPVDMLVSLYRLLRQRERRAPTFEQEIARNPHWLDLVHYHRQILPWFDRFPREQIHVAIFERFFADEERHLRGLLRFIGADEGFRPSLLGRRVNASAPLPPSRLKRLRGDVIRALDHPAMLPIKSVLHGMEVNRMSYQGVRKNGHDPRPSDDVDPAVRRFIMREVEPDLQRLEDLLGFDLDLWRDKGDAERRFPTAAPAAEASSNVVRFKRFLSRAGPSGGVS